MSGKKTQTLTMLVVNLFYPPATDVFWIHLAIISLYSN